MIYKILGANPCYARESWGTESSALTAVRSPQDQKLCSDCTAVTAITPPSPRIRSCAVTAVRPQGSEAVQ